MEAKTSEQHKLCNKEFNEIFAITFGNTVAATRTKSKKIKTN